MIFSTDNTHHSHLREEVRLVPAWSIALAIALFAFAYYFHFVIMPHHHTPPPGAGRAPAWIRIFWATGWGTVLAGYALVIGYISRDTQRRHMDRGLWMLAAVLLPGGIGTVLYFLLRQPVVHPCPACGSRIESGDNYCAQCRYQMSLVCGQCFRAVRATDVFCTRCGYDVAAEPSPVRTRELAL